MSEATRQSALLRGLQAEGTRVQKFTDLFGIGIPDIFIGNSMTGFWLELKYIPELPKRLNTPLRPKIRGPQLAWQQNGFPF